MAMKMNDPIDIFKKINDAVLDIQSAELKTYERPLTTLTKLLKHSSLEKINTGLTIGRDLDNFLNNNTDGEGALGGATLKWPEEQEEYLGLALLLILKLGSDSSFALNFSHEHYSTSNKVISGIHAMNRQLIMPFVRDYKEYVMNAGNVDPKIIKHRSNKVFIVHGHDGEARETVARFLSLIGFVPVILHEQANRGRTVIEKVEANNDVSFAVVLLTPDDVGRSKAETELEPRARQNVLLELGYFIGHLGRENVCALKRGDVEIPSDFAGVVWEKMDAGGGWKQSLGRELQAAGHSIDWNKVMG
jgi:predicted nucleotide-binding protein